MRKILAAILLVCESGLLFYEFHESLEIGRVRPCRQQQVEVIRHEAIHDQIEFAMLRHVDDYVTSLRRDVRLREERLTECRTGRDGIPLHPDVVESLESVRPICDHPHEDDAQGQA